MSETQNTIIGNGSPLKKSDIVSISDAMIYLKPEIEQNVASALSGRVNPDREEAIRKNVTNWFLDHLDAVNGFKMVHNGLIEIDYEERRRRGFYNDAITDPFHQGKVDDYVKEWKKYQRGRKQRKQKEVAN